MPDLALVRKPGCLSSCLAFVPRFIIEFIILGALMVSIGACAPKSKPAAGPFIEIGDDPVLGNRQARIAIVEFVDLECSFCLRFHLQNLPKIKKRYIDSGEVLLVVKDLPLRMHKHAFSAALMVNCASQQGAYWRMQDYLFSRQTKLGKKTYEQAISELGLDREQILACVRQKSSSREIVDDIRSAYRLGIRSTPSLAIGRLSGGRVVVTGISRGIPDMEELEKQISKIRD